jgi:hypothetical protein
MKGKSKEDVLKTMQTGIIAAISKYMKSNIEYIYTFVIDMNALMGFLIVFPIFMLILISAFAFSVYQPTMASPTTDDEDGPKNSVVMTTLHHYLYYLFVVSLIGVAMFVIYKHFI